MSTDINSIVETLGEGAMYISWIDEIMESQEKWEDFEERPVSKSLSEGSESTISIRELIAASRKNNKINE